jgi:hypothetical protein
MRERVKERLHIHLSLLNFDFKTSFSSYTQFRSTYYRRLEEGQVLNMLVRAYVMFQQYLSFQYLMSEFCH